MENTEKTDEFISLKNQDDWNIRKIQAELSNTSIYRTGLHLQEA